jgi:hypothetical protein
VFVLQIRGIRPATNRLQIVSSEVFVADLGCLVCSVVSVQVEDKFIICTFDCFTINVSLVYKVDGTVFIE